MKKLDITYRMKNRTEVAETLITLPFGDAIANIILREGTVDTWEPTKELMENLAMQQGYTYKGCVYVEEAKRK